ncbi:hypothetical protein [Actinocorallia sp. A-T 12471]|uniref:hypothetical protein n=1 Tax=Actinocorallia sp. A-T 12471 TaxID=3089813 RepID=UPI0029CF774B|nr:hypothetical protein [Actinocorallia sp. A-T 12471]MDX6744987.1 hypothetical protein [Actinocorallia sp. A-T 12471]
MSRTASGELLWELMHPDDRAWTPDAPEEYHGLHLGWQRAACVPIEWHRRTLPAVKIRVCAHTCECMVIVYELGAYGGKYLIRRTTRRAEGDRVVETDHLGAKDIGELWSRLLCGLAR